MKIRADFVTNSSSSSFCVINIRLKGMFKKPIHWENDCFGDRPEFMFPPDAENKLKAVDSLEALIDFLTECAIAADMEEEFRDECGDLLDSIASLKSFDEIASLEMSWGEFISDGGERPEEGAEGGQLSFDFKNSNCVIISEPTEFFIDELNSMFDYGDD